MIPAGEICTIWTSPEITNGPFTARSNLPEAMIEAVRDAVAATPTEAPEAFREMTGGQTSTAKGYIEVDHPRCQWIVDMRQWLKDQRRN